MVMSTTNIKNFLQENTVKSLIDEIIEQLFEEVSGIHLRQQEFTELPNEEICTIYTVFHGGYHTRFFFCAEPALMKRIAENIAEETITDEDDIKEYVKEFVNVICGHIVAAIFKKTKTSARFHCPEFIDEHEILADVHNDSIITIHYTSTESENAMFLYDKILPNVE